MNSEGSPHAIAWIVAIYVPVLCYFLPVEHAKVLAIAFPFLPALATIAACGMQWPCPTTPNSDRDWFKSAQFWNNYSALWSASLAFVAIILLSRDHVERLPHPVATPASRHATARP